MVIAVVAPPIIILHSRSSLVPSANESLSSSYICPELPPDPGSPVGPLSPVGP